MNHKASCLYIFKYASNHIKKIKKSDEMNSNTFYLTQFNQLFSLQHMINYIVEIFYIPFLYLVLKIWYVFYTQSTSHFNFQVIHCHLDSGYCIGQYRSMVIHIHTEV